MDALKCDDREVADQVAVVDADATTCGAVRARGQDHVQRDVAGRGEPARGVGS